MVGPLLGVLLGDGDGTREVTATPSWPKGADDESEDVVNGGALNCKKRNPPEVF